MEDLNGDVDPSVDWDGTRKTLVIVSHAHAPPLSPAPTLKFDLRQVKNPPKQIRDAYDGRSKRLRNHMLQEDGFVSLLNTAEADIRAEISNMSDGDGFAECLGAEQSVPVCDARDRISKPSLVVSCFCERGRHRSVAFVEELARRIEASEWSVEIVHRDVEVKRGQGRNKGHKDQRMRKGDLALLERNPD